MVKLMLHYIKPKIILKIKNKLKYFTTHNNIPKLIHLLLIALLIQTTDFQTPLPTCLASYIISLIESNKTQ